jgi:hypothetical protein
LEGDGCRYEESQEKQDRLFHAELLSERGEREGKYGDVVVLAELFCGFGDGASGLRANGLGSVEAEELATCASRVHVCLDAVARDKVPVGSTG